MKTLYLLRHGKAGWGGVGSTDHERSLDVDGVTASKRLGLHMVKHTILPDLILYSSAKRVVETLKAILSAVSPSLPSIEKEEIYNATKHSLLALINATDNSLESLMVIGHNPTMHELSHSLVGDGDQSLRDHLLQGFPSGTIVGITFDVDTWADVRDNGGTIIHLDSPDERPLGF